MWGALIRCAVLTFAALAAGCAGTSRVGDELTAACLGQPCMHPASRPRLTVKSYLIEPDRQIYPMFHVPIGRYYTERGLKACIQNGRMKTVLGQLIRKIFGRVNFC